LAELGNPYYLDARPAEGSIGVKTGWRRKIFSVFHPKAPKTSGEEKFSVWRRKIFGVFHQKSPKTGGEEIFSGCRITSLCANCCRSGTFMEISRKCPQKAQKASTLPRHLCPVGANGAMTKRHETVGAIAKRPLDAPRYYSGHGEGPTSSIRPPSHAWRARQDGKSGRRGASGTKRPLGRSAAPTESPLHAPRACPTLRDSLPPHAAIGGNA
jgi:hypothetical protein